MIFLLYGVLNIFDFIEFQSKKILGAKYIETLNPIGQNSVS